MLDVTLSHGFASKLPPLEGEAVVLMGAEQATVEATVGRIVKHGGCWPMGKG